jgi:hypothetical protein
MANTDPQRYQNKVAGRTREDEDRFNLENAVMLPTGLFSTRPQGAKKQPTLDTDALKSPDVGKPDRSDTREKEIGAYNPNSYNSTESN